MYNAPPPSRLHSRSKTLKTATLESLGTVPTPSLEVGHRGNPERPDWSKVAGFLSITKTTAGKLEVLTDSSLETGEAPILRHHVGVVALAGQHLHHLPSLLPLPHPGLQENSKANVSTIGSKLPPADKSPFPTSCVGWEALPAVPRRMVVTVPT